MPSITQVISTTPDNPLNPAFWRQPAADRETFFARLRGTPEPAFFPYRPLRDGAEPYGFYALVRHADIVEVARHPEVFSSSPAATLDDLPPAFNKDSEGSLLHMDGQRHSNMRRAVSQAFTPRGIGRQNELIDSAVHTVVSELLDKMPCDFVVEAAVQLPLRVICSIVGIPASEYLDVVQAVDVVTEINDMSDPQRLSAVSNAVVYFDNLMSDIADLRRVNPTSDLATTLVQATVDGCPLTPAELGAYLRILLVGGNDTIRSTLSHMLFFLTEHPAQKRLLLENLETLMPGAVEETLRLATPGTWMRRNVLHETTVAGHSFHPGDRVILYFNSGNRDDAVFNQPDFYDITRNPNPHLSFGAPNPHFCLGAHLAKREVSTFFRELLTRAPKIHATTEPVHTYSGLVHNIANLECATA